MNPTSAKDDSAAHREGALIYVVDDEPLLVDLAEMALQPEGYRVKKFYAGATTLKSLAAEAVQPALLITDYAMSPMNGVELSEQCKQIHPGLKIIMVSGTAGPEIIVTARVKIDRFLQKPYRPNALIELVRSVLAE